MSHIKNFSHESFSRIDKIKPGSEKAFGITFATVFLLLAVLPVLFQHPIRVWALFLSLIFLVISFISPQLLKPLNLFWLKFGLFLNIIISPIILFLLYWMAFVPTGLLLKLLKKDVLTLKFDKLTDSYWIKSDTQVNSMKDQF